MDIKYSIKNHPGHDCTCIECNPVIRPSKLTPNGRGQCTRCGRKLTWYGSKWMNLDTGEMFCSHGYDSCEGKISTDALSYYTDG